jgi:drug/metabolite transporter (DMT)-like permease
MNREHDTQPITIEQTVTGIAFALVVGVAGVWLTVAPEDDFRPSDALIPGLIGIGVGLVVAAFAFYIFFIKHISSKRAQWVPVPLLGGLALLFTSAPPALRVGVSAGGAVMILCLMIAAAMMGRRESAPGAGTADPP